ncbi:septum formation inhibitor Maf [Hydrogenovibrio sp. SC-1]|uniref:Maf family protein n=1 Tax=Hydrogenovibrio sp. SC-1 TaxID=2065820 RepID=UPI000C7AD102|nr:Maf family nucleotide pyrophosphatase [Hydrogenovibrio sp. SC-1]PLA75603.1 septum formation inhibitor Maf [Hydrogenovibrio sp. SC-1]
MNQNSFIPQIILASTSPFRKQLLEKLQLPFETANPKLDETPLTNESVIDMVQRLSRQKAQVVASQYPDAIVIGSDQSATFNGKAIGKPRTHANAIKQLQQFSGHTIEFLTGLAVVKGSEIHQAIDITRVQFRQLSDTEIEHYLRLETPYQCAGSFKSEGLGITLFEEIQSKDPNALIGLPLIELTTLLKKCGIALPYNYKHSRPT